MAITFQKRQKEMKRQEKAREKAERRAQKKLAKRAEKEQGSEILGDDLTGETLIEPEKPEIQN